MNSFLLFNKLDNLKMISSDKKVSDGIYFIQGKIYSESVKKDETLLADGYAIVNRIEKKKMKHYTQSSAPNRSLWSNGEVTSFYNKPIHIGKKELKLLNKENVSLTTPIVELNTNNVIAQRTNDIQRDSTKLANGTQQFYSYRVVGNNENVVVLGKVDGNVVKELPARYGKSIYIGDSKAQIIKELKSNNNSNWIYLFVLVALTSISGFVLYMYSKGKWTNDIFSFTVFGRKFN